MGDGAGGLTPTIRMTGVGSKRASLGVAALCHPEPASRLHEQAVATGEGSLRETRCGVVRGETPSPFADIIAESSRKDFSTGLSLTGPMTR